MVLNCCILFFFILAADWFNAMKREPHYNGHIKGAETSCFFFPFEGRKKPFLYGFMTPLSRTHSGKEMDAFSVSL